MNMRIYGVYSLEDYPDWNILVTDIEQHYVEGLAFDLNGNFETKVTFKPVANFIEIGYIYHTGNIHLKLSLI